MSRVWRGHSCPRDSMWRGRPRPRFFLCPQLCFRSEVSGLSPHPQRLRCFLTSFTRGRTQTMSTVLITGASGGIGYELAKLFSRDHHNLVLVARSGDKLAQVAAELQEQNVTVKTFALDLATPLPPKFLFDQLQIHNIAVDILINNAGFGAFGEFAQMSNDEIFGQIQLNIIALTE